jgi:peptidoglycan/LPS O-acetylase OafA/YrhL
MRPMNKPSSGKNLDIHFFKFYYAWIIVLFHLGSSTAISCDGGFYAVEFFLLTAGVFFFLGYEKQCAKSRLDTPGQYLKKRFFRLFPWGATALLAAVVIQRFVIDRVTSPVALMDYFSSDIWELLLVKWNGINDNTQLLNGPAWTLSSMCIVGFLLWGCLYYYNERFLNLFMPLTLLVGYGFWRHIDAANTELWIGFTTFGTLRTWLVMCLGFYCLTLAQKLSAVPLNRGGKTLLTVVEICIHVFVTYVMLHRSTRYYQWLVTLLFLVAIAIAQSQKSYLPQWMNRFRVFDFLGELSMSVYLMHVPVILLFRWRFDVSSWSYKQLLPVFAAILLAAVVHYYATKYLIALTRKGCKACKRLLQN